MRTVRASRLVAAPLARVWALYDDIANTPAWVPFSEEILSLSPGPTDVGTVYRERTSLAGIRDVGEWEITEHDPPTRQVHVSTDKGMRSELVITMADAGDGVTWLAQAVHLRSTLPGPFGWAHEVVFAAVARHGIRGAVDGAAAYLRAADGPART